MTPIITICLITANRPAHLKQALLSIKEQKYQQFELIVSDDSTGDESKPIVKALFPKALYIHNKPSLKEILNSNKVLSQAKTEYVCLFHDDDILGNEYLSSIVPVLKKYPRIDMAFTGRVMVDQDNHVIARQVLNSKRKIYTFTAKKILNFMLLGSKIKNYRVFINTPGLIFKKSIFQKIGGFDVQVDTHCDTDFILRSLTYTSKVLFINEPLFINRIWYGVSGRTKSSERGEVFQAEKGVIDNFLKFCKVNKFEYYLTRKTDIYRYFADKSIDLNGPLSWISVRFKGSYSDKVIHLTRTFKEILSLNPRNIFNPRLYLIYLISVITPQVLSKMALKYLLRVYNNKS